MFYNKKLYDKAIEQFKKAADSSPRSFNAHYNLANAYRELKMFNEAIEEYNVALTISPVEYKTYFDLGIAYREQQNYTSAVSSFEKSLQINSNQVDPHEELGMIYYRNLKDNAKAVYHFEKVLSKKPNHPDADKMKSIIHLIKGK